MQTMVLSSSSVGANLWALCVISAAAGVLIALLFLKRRQGRRLSLPPGSPGWPVLGETLEYVFNDHALGTLSPYMSKRLQRYGKIFKTRILGSPTVVSADPELNKILLQKEEDLVQASYPKSMRHILGFYNFAELNGGLHKRIISTIDSFVSSSRLRGVFLKESQDAAIWVLKSWKEKEVVYVQDEVKMYAFNFIARKVVGLKPGDALLTTMRQDFTHFSPGLFAVPINLPGTTYRRAMNGRRNLIAIFKNMIERRKSELHGVAHDDFLDVLLRDVDHRGQHYSEEMMLDFMVSMFFAAHDTSAVIMTTAIKFLTDHPNVLEEFQAEHASIRGTKQDNEMLSWDDYKRMHLTQKVINETLRLTNVLEFAHRMALQDISVKGFTIPRGWKIFLSYPAVHLDPKLYPDPLKFNPWRWQETPNFSTNFTPFGGGRKMCAGPEVARLEIAIFLHYLVTLYRWEAAEPDQGRNFPPVRMLKRLPIRVRPA